MNPIDMSDHKESDERYQINKNDEVNVSDVIEDLNMGKLSSHENLENVEKEYDKRNRMDISDDKESAEIYERSKNYEETVNDVDEESDKRD